MANGLLPHWTETIRSWAAGEPLILEVYAFGSRVKGGYRPDSDLDIAIKVDGSDEGEQLGNAICEKERWLETLSALVPVSVDLQAMFPDDVVVYPAVQGHGVLLYRR